MKYTDEQLSRILGECDRNALVRSGAMWPDTRCCINQAAFNIPEPTLALRERREPAYWFDRYYGLDGGVVSGHVDALLFVLEEKGFA